MRDHESSTLTVSADELIHVIESVIKSGSSFKLLVTGSSMSPFLGHLRDSVILTSTAGHLLKRGDIVLIHRRESDSYVLHRVIKMKPDGFIMNGDAQTWTEFVPFEQVIAIVQAIERKSRLIFCDNRLYRFFSRLWMLLRPFRGLLFKMIGLLSVIYRRIITSK